MKSLWQPGPFCSFCDGPSITSFEVEAGNDAEVWIPIELCQDHAAENDRDENAFDKKYADRFNELASQREVRE